MRTTDGSMADGLSDLAKVDVAAATRVLVVRDLHLTSRPTACSLAVAAELAAALDAWVGPGLLVLNGRTYDLTSETDPDPCRVIAVHPRLERALDQFAEQESRRIVFLAGCRDEALGDP